jgi:UPF0755 protein
MRKNKSPTTRLVLLAFGLMICLVLVIAGTIIFGLPIRAAQIYGSPASHLSTNQRLRLSALLLWKDKQLNSPTNPLAMPVDFQVDLGEPLPIIAARMVSDGIIPDQNSFIAYLQYAGLDTTIQSGEYELSPAMTPREIAHQLQDATPKEVTFNILEGWRSEEIAASLPTSGLAVSPQAFLEVARLVTLNHPLLENLPAGTTLEGFLMPGSYQIPRQATTEELINQLLDNFVMQVTYDLLEGFDRQGLSLFEAVTLASIVEREAMNEEEMPLIASVFLNRLAIGMKLEADSTVQYALGFNQEQNTWWTNPLTLEHLEINSPYNTYHYPGLPPGPIANPGLQAIRAVAFPAQTPYFYFRAACDDSGRHVFAVTFDEHLLNACPSGEE